MTLVQANAVIEANAWIPRDLAHRSAWDSLVASCTAIVSDALGKAARAAKQSEPLEGVVVDDEGDEEST